MLKLERIMNDFLSNGIFQTVVGSILVALIMWLITRAKNERIETKIISFLEESRNDTDYLFRSTNSISSALNLSEEKINKICSSSKKIARNQKEKESWKLR